MKRVSRRYIPLIEPGLAAFPCLVFTRVATVSEMRWPCCARGSTSPPLPSSLSLQSARHSHTAVAWEGCLILFGGELASGFLANDVWIYLPREGRWQEMVPVNTMSLLPPGLAGHASAVVDEWLYIFGGEC